MLKSWFALRFLEVLGCLFASKLSMVFGEACWFKSVGVLGLVYEVGDCELDLQRGVCVISGFGDVSLVVGVAEWRLLCLGVWTLGV